MRLNNGEGAIISRGDWGFDEAVLGTSFSAEDPPYRPDIVVQANDVSDVVSAVQRAARDGLKISICSGGHSWSQNHIRDGGLLLDLSRLNRIEIDAGARTAIVGPGCLSGDFDAALAKQNLFFPVAHAYTVGMGGFLLQGGFGWNSRMVGVACESVSAVDVVLADGSLVHADETENADIYWAARGSGPGFFGVVVAFHLKLHSRPKFTGMKMQVFRIRHMEDVVRWANSVGPEVSPKVEFQMVFNRKALGIFSHGIEVVTPILADSRREARELVSFIDKSPVKKKASFTLPIIPLSLNRIMKAAEKVIFWPNTRWATDNMWLKNGPVDSLLPKIQHMVDTQPPPPAHTLWMNWNPISSARPDMAFSLESQTYFALYGGQQDKKDAEKHKNWATENARAMEENSIGVQLADENLARRSAPFMARENFEKLEMLRKKYDPDQRFFSYGDAS